MKNYTPKLYIGVGDTGAFFTLRETYLHSFVVGGKMHYEERSYHHFNLSQDADEAIEKATEASIRIGVPLDKIDRKSLDGEMRKIQRADADEMARREQERKNREASWAAVRAIDELKKLDLIAAGYIPFGAHSGELLETAPRGYITWLIEKRAEFEPGSLMRALAERVVFHHRRMAFPTPSGRTLGGIGERITAHVTVIRTHSFERPRFNAEWLTETIQITSMVDHETGALLVSFSSSWRPKEGEELDVRATVKSHEDFRGTQQTIIQRPTLAPNKAERTPRKKAAA